MQAPAQDPIRRRASKLDDIFKQGVLDVPESIRLARETVDDYNRFSENFHSMEDKMERVAILQDIQARYGEYAKQASERREYTPIDPDREQGETTLAAWTWSRMASEVRAGLPSAQRKAKESQDAIDRSQQRIDELDTQIEAVKERMNGIDGGSCSNSARTSNAHARTPTRRADNGTPSPNGSNASKADSPPTSRHGTPNAPRSPCRSTRTTSVWKTRDPNTSEWWWNVTPGRANATC